MATLPRKPIAQEPRNAYQGGGGNQPRMQASTAMADATANAGNAMAEIGRRMRDAQISAEVAEAQLDLTDRLDQEFRLIETDTQTDPRELEDNFRIRAQEVVKIAGEKMSSPLHKRLWNAQAEKQVTDYSIRTRDVSRKRTVERTKATTMRVGEKYSQVALDPSKPREVMEASAQEYKALIEQQHKSGLYNEAETEAMLIQADATLRQGISMRHLSNIDALSDDGRHGEAEAYFKANYDEIDPRQREAFEEVLQKRSLDAQVMQGADNIWLASGKNYDTALDKVREIEDPDRRRMMEQRIGELSSQDNAMRGARETEAYNEGLTSLLDGGSYESLSPSLLADMGPTKRRALEAESNRRKQEALTLRAMSAEERRRAKEAQTDASNMFMTYLAAYPEAREIVDTVPATEWAEHGQVGKWLADEWQGMSNNDRTGFYKKHAQDQQQRAAKAEEDMASALEPDNLQSFTLEVLEQMRLDPPRVQRRGWTGRYTEEMQEFTKSDFKTSGTGDNFKDYTDFERRVISRTSEEMAKFIKQNGPDAKPTQDDIEDIKRRVFRSIDPDTFGGTFTVGAYNVVNDAVKASGFDRAEIERVYKDAVKIHGPDVTQQQIVDLAMALRKRQEEAR